MLKIEKLRLHTIVCLLSLLSPAALLYRPATVDGATGMPAGAAVVERVADLVQTHYADPVAGERIAACLRRDLHRGAFAGVATTAELGRRLDERLQALTAGGGIDVVLDPAASTGQGIEGRWLRALLTPEDVGVLDIDRLPDVAVARDPLHAALRGLRGAVALVIDLRGADGGDAETARYLASHLFDHPVALSGTETAASGWTARRTLDEVPGPRFVDEPVFLLVDARTSGAAEGLAYDLRQLGRATVVGEPTAGEAWSVAELELGRGLVLRTPTSRPRHSGSGTDWQGIGLLPDLRVPAASALDVARREALRARGEELPPRPLGIAGSGAISHS